MLNSDTIYAKYTKAVSELQKLEAEFDTMLDATVENGESKLNDLAAKINTLYKEIKTQRKLLIHATYPLVKER